jgi:LCP family protein required for cell wall assembly
MKRSSGGSSRHASRPHGGAVPADEGAEASVGGRAAARSRGKKRQGKRALKIVGLAMGFVLLLGGGFGAYAYWKLSGNIKSDDLSANGVDGAGHEKQDAFGRSPINILVIGSDARANASDCKLGGACGSATGARADVEMVVHISADRSNATVMSIPRDLRTDWTGCHDSGHASMGPQTDAMINSALAGGPGCSVVAVHQLTGIPIDHFMMIDFSGVVRMSNAVGGVGICVDANVYDPYSHLKLKEGPHVLKGDAALEFLRTRHGFGDSSDSRGRTAAQHIFLGALLDRLKSGGTLGSPTKMWSLADAATKALTVDNGLDSPTKLIDLAGDLNKVPTKRVTFATMQTHDVTVAGRSQTLITEPGAPALFRSIANDQSLTTPSGGKAAAPSGTGTAGATATATATATQVPTGSIAVRVENGTTVGGRAGAIAQELISQGFSNRTTFANGTPAATTSLTYPPGEQAQARTVAAAHGGPAAAVKAGTGSGIVLLIGGDWPSGAHFPGARTTPAPVDTQVALDDANKQFGSSSTCVQVSTFDDVIGVTDAGTVTSEDNPPHSTSPSHAYAISPEVKDSAP